MVGGVWAPECNKPDYATLIGPTRARESNATKPNVKVIQALGFVVDAEVGFVINPTYE